MVEAGSQSRAAACAATLMTNGYASPVTARRTVLASFARREWKGELVLLHEVTDGPADRSYGIAVAKLAGLPPAVLARAKAVLAKLEAGRAATGGIAAGLDDLPLFAATAAEESVADPVREALAKMQPDSLSPATRLSGLSTERLARNGHTVRSGSPAARRSSSARDGRTFIGRSDRGGQVRNALEGGAWRCAPIGGAALTPDRIAAAYAF